jgi:spore coat protein CotH
MTRGLIACLLLAACHPARPPGWDEATHGPTSLPAYDRLFDDTRVLRLDIAIDPADHEAMQSDLQRLLSSPTDGPLALADPLWVPVDAALDGVTFRHVGMRYKGNSSLKSAIQSGIAKLAFRLNADRFEDDYPSIHDQRLFGFKKMTFSNAFKDPSLVRDKLAADIFRRGGVPAARGAFVRVYVDFGSGPIYFGLYTMIEDPSDQMLASQFGGRGGNLYKPEPMRGPDSAGASWASFVAQDFVKQTNEGSGLDDVRAVLDALHATGLTPAAWRAGLEAVFEVNGFLRWLAINQVMENWDSYLCIPHNYYVYADPGLGGRLRWFPWDLNEAMLHRTGRCQPSELAWSVFLEEAGPRRPLVRRLLDDPEYARVYRDELRATLEGAFELGWIGERMRAYHALIAPWVIGPEGEASPYTFLRSAAEFEGSIEGEVETPLWPHALARHDFVWRALSTGGP